MNRWEHLGESEEREEMFVLETKKKQYFKEKGVICSWDTKKRGESSINWFVIIMILEIRE